MSILFIDWLPEVQKSQKKFGAEASLSVLEKLIACVADDLKSHSDVARHTVSH